MQVFLWACFGVLCFATPRDTYFNKSRPRRYACSDTILPCRAGDEKLWEKVQKFGYERFLTKNKRVKNNPDVNMAFKDIIDSMHASKDKFLFILDTTATHPGSVRYENGVINIRITSPGPVLGTRNGMEGILFEEVRHVKQFLDGEIIFQCARHNCTVIPCKDAEEWKPATNVWKEVEAKRFVIDQLDIIPTFDSADKKKFTVLFFLKRLPTDWDRASYLLHGWKQGVIRIDRKRAEPVYTPLYPEFVYCNVINPDTLGDRLKDGCYLAYPKRVLVK